MNPAARTLVVALVAGWASAAFAEDLFRDDVVPILRRHCLRCHQGGEAEGGLDLSTLDGLRRGGESGLAAVAPGKLEESYLWDLVEGDEPDMPKSGDPLDARELAVLKRWITSGAVWPEGLVLEANPWTWWSLQPLKRPPLPKVASDWVRTPIDAFIFEKLAEHGLEPSPDADRRTLVRRLYFDLTGLPPTPGQVAAFVADDDPAAYEDLVDRLLASPAYGERWARHWLDVVKYADTCGYDKDKLRPNAWPYRDYVIRSFNEDKPYARFVQEQIAGDVLFPGEPDGVLGLGFLAAGPWDFIGHVEVSEAKIDGKIARHLDRDEMVSNAMNTFASVTVECARCHDHKFDPFTQQHYYGLQAVFAAVDRAERRYGVSPEAERRRDDLTARLAALRAESAALDAEIKERGGAELASLEKEIARLRPLTSPQSKRPEYGYHSHIEKMPTEAKWVQIDLGREIDLRRIVLHPCHDEFAGIGSGFGFPLRFKVEAANDEQFARPTLLADETQADFPNPGLAAYAIEKPVTARFLRVTATTLAERSNDYIFALSEVEAFDGSGKNVALGVNVMSLDSIEAAPRWRRTNLVDGVWPAAGDPHASAALAKATQKHRALVDRIHTPDRMEQRNKLDAEVKSTSDALNGLPKGNMVYAAATEFDPQGNFQPTRGKPRPIHVLHRGNVLDPRDEARPGALPLSDSDPFEFNLSTGATEGDRRAALARWLTRPDHPLLWRSIVNRIWQYHFGRGIVASPNDFGRMGQEPTHPELLDWLAVEFRDGGQSMKRLHRLIVTSSVYRQASDHRESAARSDGGNRYLWRMNRRRLEAEEIRDAILSVSGRMNRAMGGPGYYLFILEKTAHSPHYQYHKFDLSDAASHRRSVYRFVVRSQPNPYMTTLDCADSSQSTPQRDETITALGALSLLNNRFNLVMAQNFADRLEAEADGLSSQIDHAMRLVAGRPPTPDEKQQLATYAAEHGLPNLCRVLFNLSEFVYMD